MNTSLRRGAMATVLGAAMVAAGVAGAGPAAAGPPVGGCPPGGGWGLFPASYAAPQYDAGNWSDANGDFYSCFRHNRGLSKKSGPFVNSFTIIDNVVQGG